MSEFVASLRQSWQEAVAPLRQRWLMLAPRDQQFLRVLGIFVGILVLVYGIWLPSHRAAQKAQAQYEQNRELLAQLHSSSPQANTTPAAGGSLLVLASDAAASSALSFSRIEPEGDAQVRVWVDRADFNAVAAWLARLSAQGVKLQEGQAEKQGEGQGVSARFVLTR
ncbi:MAG: type II secretion system protein M [Pedobacter sp.]|nr:type II secretion system protein M [Pedobacter sp.]